MAASRPITTSLTVGYGESSNAKILWESDPRREAPEFYQEYLRLYPIGVPSYFTNSGNLGKLSNQTETVDDIAVFSGTSEVSLRYPESFIVGMQLVGKFYDMEGNPTTSTFAFDASRNLITSSKPGYGALEIRVQVNYTLFLFTFAGGPCPGMLLPPYIPPTLFGGSSAYSTSGGSTGTGVSAATTADEKSPFDPAVVVAIDSNRKATATIRLNPPECERQEFYVDKGDEAELPRVTIEVDPRYPEGVEFSTTQKADNTIPLWWGCGLRVIPKSSKIDVDVNLPDATLKRDTTKESTQYVEDNLLFSGSTSRNLKYHPMGSLAITKRGIYRNKWGETELVSFRGPGEKVTEVEWTSKNSYRNPRQRYVGPNELVAVDSWGKAKEIFGVVDVSYSYDFLFYRLRVPYINGTRELRSAFVTAINDVAADDQQPGSQRVVPPSLEGFWD